MSIDREAVRPDELAAMFEGCGLRPSMRCALAVSGGSDSAALMVLFAAWLGQSGGSVRSQTVLVVDHGLRPQSAAEAQAVCAAAAALGYRHATLVWEGPKPQTGIQAAARAERYRLMAEYVRAKGIAALLTGHTRDDQAETLLMRLARGSGLDGLAGMAPRLSFSDLGLGERMPDEPLLMRPLLDVAKVRLRATLRERGMAWVEDPSNASPDFERARLRAARPQLDALGLTDAMLALSAVRLQRARKAVDSAVEQFCSSAADAVSVHPCGYFAIDGARLRAAEPEIAVRALGRVVAAAGGSDQPVPLGKLEAIAVALQGAEARPATWTLARAMIVDAGETVTVEREPGREPPSRLEVQPGTRMRWDGRFRVEADASVASVVEVGPLGESAARELRLHHAPAMRVPLRAMALAPSFRQEGRLLAVPCLGFWADADWRAALRAQFLWCEALGARDLAKEP